MAHVHSTAFLWDILGLRTPRVSYQVIYVFIAFELYLQQAPRQYTVDTYVMNETNKQTNPLFSF